VAQITAEDIIEYAELMKSTESKDPGEFLFQNALLLASRGETMQARRVILYIQYKAYIDGMNAAKTTKTKREAKNND